MRRLTLSLLLALAVASQAVAATGWERLSELRPGDKVTVVHTNGSEERGEFVSVSQTGLTVRTGGAEKTVGRPEIARVQSPAKSKALRNAAIGAAIGLAGAIAADQTWGHFLNNEGGYSAGAKAGVWGIPIGVGAALGALTGRNPTIYKAK